MSIKLQIQTIIWTIKKSVNNRNNLNLMKSKNSNASSNLSIDRSKNQLTIDL